MIERDLRKVNDIKKNSPPKHPREKYLEKKELHKNILDLEMKASKLSDQGDHREERRLRKKLEGLNTKMDEYKTVHRRPRFFNGFDNKRKWTPALQMQKDNFEKDKLKFGISTTDKDVTKGRAIEKGKEKLKDQRKSFKATVGIKGTIREQGKREEQHNVDKAVIDSKPLLRGTESDRADVIESFFMGGSGDTPDPSPVRPTPVKPLSELEILMALPERDIRERKIKANKLNLYHSRQREIEELISEINYLDVKDQDLDTKTLPELRAIRDLSLKIVKQNAKLRKHREAKSKARDVKKRTDIKEKAFRWQSKDEKVEISADGDEKVEFSADEIHRIARDRTWLPEGKTSFERLSSVYDDGITKKPPSTFSRMKKSGMENLTLLNKILDDSLGSSENEKTVRITLSVLAGIYNSIYSSWDPITVFFAAEQIVYSIFGNTYSALKVGAGLAIVSKALQRNQVKKDAILPQSFEQKLKRALQDDLLDSANELEDIAKALDDLTTNPLVSGFSDCILGLSLYHIFPKETADTLWAVLGKPHSRPSIFQLLKDMLVTLASFIRVADSMASGLTLMEALTKGLANMRSLDMAQLLLVEETRIYYGNLCGDDMARIDNLNYSIDNITMNIEARDWLMKSGTALELMKIVPSFTGKDAKFKRLQFMTVRALLSTAYERVIHKIRTMNRVPPVFLALIGTPGVGKSKALELINTVISKAYGMQTYSRDMVYHRNMSSEYHDGLKNFKHYIFHYSELGQMKSDLLKSNMPAPMSEILSLIDSQEVIANMAAVEDKGKYPLYPIAVVADSNNPSLGFNDTHKYLGAIFRRMWRITLRVKPEYLQNDVLRSDIPLGDQYRIWDWHFEKFGTSDNPVVTTDLWFHGPDSTQQFCKMLYLEVSSHINKNRAINNNFNDLNLNLKIDQWIAGELPIQVQAKSEKVNYAEEIKKYISTKSEGLQEVVSGGLALFVLKLLPKKPATYHKKRCWEALFNILGASMVTLVLFRLFFLALLVFCILVCFSLASLFEGSLVINNKINQSAALLSVGWDKLIGTEEDGPKNARYKVMHTIVLSLVVGLSSASIALALYNRAKEKNKDDSIKVQSEPTEVMSKFSRPVYNARESNGAIMQWIAQSRPRMNVFTDDIKSLEKAISKNVRYAHVYRYEPDGKYMMRTHVLGLFGPYCMVNFHTFKNKTDNLCIRVYSGQSEEGSYLETKLKLSDGVRVRDDSFIFVCSGLNFKNIIPFFNEEYEPKLADGSIDGHQTSIIKLPSSHRTVDGQSIDCPYQYEWPGNAVGKCGLPLLSQLNTGACILGIHMGAIESLGFAQPLLRGDLQQAIRDLPIDGLMPIVPQCVQVELSQNIPHKHVSHYEDSGILDVLGKLPGNCRVQTKSGVTRSILSHSQANKNVLRTIFAKYGLSTDKEFGAPIIKPCMLNGDYVPYNRIYRGLSHSRFGLCQDTLKWVVSEYTQKFTRVFNESNRFLGPVGVEDAVNGVDIDVFFRGINLSTSAGHGLRGVKRDYFDIDEETKHATPKPLLMDLIISQITDILQGNSPAFIFKGSLKDEITSMTKIQSGKTRMFYGMSLTDLIISRMFLGNFFTSFVELGDRLGSCVGVNCHTEGHKWKRDFDFGAFMSDWDHKDYDLDNLPDVSWAAASIVYYCCAMQSNVSYDSHAIASILSNAISPHIDFNGVLIRAPGNIPSGNYATAEMNCLRGLVMLLYAFHELGTHQGYNKQQLSDLYFTCVLPRFYGDDSRVHLKTDVAEWFNAESIAKCYKEMGLNITSATKDSSLQKFTKQHDMVFLKRSLRFRHDLQRWVLPLEFSSILKSLEWTIPSKAVTAYDQMLGTLDSALRELFFLLEFSDYVNLHRELTEYVSACLQIDPSFLATKVVQPEALFKDFRIEDSLSTQSSAWSISSTDYSKNLESVIFTANYNNYRERLIHHISIWEDERKELTTYCDEVGIRLDGLSATALLKQSNQSMNVNQKERLLNESRYVSRYEELCSSINYARDLLANSTHIEFQSHDVAVSSHGPPPDAQLLTTENFTDMSGDVVEEVSLLKARKHHAGFAHTNVDLNDWFSRPVFLTNFGWAPGVDIDNVISLWDSYLGDPTVRAKLRNVSMIRADVVVDVSCSGNMFQYGAMAVAPIPMPNEVAPLISLLNSMLSAPAQHTNVAKYLVSLPGSQILDPNQNKVLRFKIPFVSPMNAIRLFNNQSTALGAATSFTDANNLLHLRFSTINQLNSTSTTSTNASIAVYMHLENVELGPPTGTVMTITTQSDDTKAQEKDERSIGPVEWVASRMAHVSGLLTSVPYIQPYALASEMAFGTLAKVAAIFGFSTPNLNTPPHRIKPTGFQNQANTIGYDTGYKITMDPKQEITVSPSIVGDDIDYMNIRAMAAIPSLLTSKAWSTSTPPLTNIVEVAIHPKAKETVASGLVNVAQPTWLDFATAPFGKWRGRIKVRGSVVCSPQHKGKLAWAINPDIAQVALISGSVSLNKHYMFVIDIQETRDIEFYVDWQFPREWADNIADNISSPMVGTLSYQANWFEACNGYLTVFPLTQLQSPNNAGCYINIYISCEDLMVTEPVSTFIPTKRILYQSEDQKVEELTYEERMSLHGWCPDDYKFPISNDCRSLANIMSEIYVYQLWFGEEHRLALIGTRKYFLTVLWKYRDRYKSLKDARVITPQSMDSKCCEESIKTLINPTGITEMDCCENTFGEHCVSFRGLLHRFSTTSLNHAQSPGTTFRSFVYNAPVLPPGQVMGSDSNDNALLSYLRLAFLGYHGGIRHRVSFPGVPFNVSDVVHVALASPSTTTTAANWAVASSVLPQPIEGTVSFVPSTTNAIEFEIPYYSVNNFAIACNNDGQTPQSGSTYLQPNALRNFNVFFNSHATVLSSYVIDEISVADDFSLLRPLAPAPYHF